MKNFKFIDVVNFICFFLAIYDLTFFLVLLLELDLIIDTVFLPVLLFVDIFPKLSLLPIIIFVAVFEKQIMDGIMAGGVKA